MDALYLLGSTARNEAGPESDIDIFIDQDPESRFSLISLIQLQDFLTAALNRPLDLTTRGGLHPVIKNDIVQEAVRVL